VGGIFCSSTCCQAKNAVLVVILPISTIVNP
jgi:hypothetical protein